MKKKISMWEGISLQGSQCNIPEIIFGPKTAQLDCLETDDSTVRIKFYPKI